MASLEILVLLSDSYKQSHAMNYFVQTLNPIYSSMDIFSNSTSISQTVSILGCGWLGFSLAKQLVKEGYTVKGSTTQLEKLTSLQEAGIQPFYVEFTPTLAREANDFFDADVLIINIPPRLRWREADFHLQQMKALLACVSEKPIQQVVLVSSTSVYPDLNRVVSEADVSTVAQAASPVLVEVENLLHTHFQDKLLVLRCGGLMGYDRIPAKYFAGWKGLTTGETPVNFIHRDDVVGIISLALGRRLCGVFNAVAPKHPFRREVYLKNCQQFGFELPTFVDSPAQDFKIVSSEKLASHYTFLYSDPLDFW